MFAWYNLIGTAGGALGLVIGGWTVQVLSVSLSWNLAHAYRLVFVIYAFLGFIKLALSFAMSAAIEPPRKLAKPAANDRDHNYAAPANGAAEPAETTPFLPARDETRAATDPTPPAPTTTSKLRALLPTISPKSRTILLKLCLILAVDSFASGIMTTSWLSYFFSLKFALPSGALGTLFFTTGIIAAISNLFAASLARRIGLIRTMVFTHLPSAICLALIPLPNTVAPAMLLLILRSCTSSMDQAPRQAFLSAVVLAEERTAVMGVVNLVKTLGQSGGPSVTGWLAGTGRFWMAFVLAGGLKAGYDLGLLGMFVGVGDRGDEDERRGAA